MQYFQHFEKYGGGYLYELHISPGQREDLNTTDYLNSLYDKIKGKLDEIYVPRVAYYSFDSFNRKSPECKSWLACFSTCTCPFFST